MALTGDFAGIAAQREELADLSQVNGRAFDGVKRAVRDRTKPLLQSEFASSSGPTGRAWARRVDNRPALVSRKLPGTVYAARSEEGLVFGLRRSWLESHQKGHHFPPRQQAARSRAEVRSGTGRLLSYRAALRRTRGATMRVAADGGVAFTKVNKKGRERVVVSSRSVGISAHGIRGRVLQRRQILFDQGDAIPTPWAVAVNGGVEAGLRRWYERQGR